jgi:hypothetical protein
MKDLPCSGISIMNTVKMAMQLKANSAIINIPITFFTEIQENPKIHMKAQNTLKSKNNTE